MKFPTLPSILLCLIVAATFGVELLRSHNDSFETVAKAVVVIGMLLLALGLAVGGRRSAHGED